MDTKQARNACQRLAFPVVSKACTSKFYIFPQFTYIIYEVNYYKSKNAFTSYIYVCILFTSNIM